MKRLVVLAACGAPAAPLSAHVAAPPPCPAGIEKRLDKQDVDACVFGHFPQAGWIVFASTPYGPQAETYPDQVRALVLRDGTIAFETDDAFADGAQRLTAIDLDHDGTDEIVEELDWHDLLGPQSGSRLTMFRVRGDKLEEAVSATISAHTFTAPEEEIGCDGKLVITATQVTIDVTPLAGNDATSGDCLAAGHHVVDLAGTH